MTKSAPAKAFCSDTACPMAKLRGQSVAQEPLGQNYRRHVDTPTTLVRTVRIAKKSTYKHSLSHVFM